ncbi:FG-GAP-like repeat-containing protein [Gemmata sp. JC673]|uniref:FG-GAP-like repeat-containing protein n=1 Tax=Gemmata algarum TaxID=2975278 RepID=A0ABU5F2N1_9BACT|nr:FG-GAP-like repeat-containing protein [Gemmata algarum]MDY3560970.1 FG-GAP-like repeat-containing protein [Gemmata algarum]
MSLIPFSLRARLNCESFEDRTVPAAGVLEISFASNAFETPGAAINVTVVRTDGSDGIVSATLTATGGTAISGTDFAAGPFTVTFAPGEVTKVVTVPVTDDTRKEQTETATFTLSNPTGGATLGTSVSATASIFDDDGTLVASAQPASQFASPQQTTVNISAANSSEVLPTGFRTSFVPFAGFNGPLSVALGDVNRDGIRDVIVGASVNGHVKVLDGATGAELRSFLAYPGYPGAVRVAAGDVNGDGVADIIVGADINAHVKVFDGATGAELRSFLAYPGFPGAVDVAAADVTGDGIADIITGAGINGHVKVFDGKTNVEVRSFLAYSGYTGPALVAAGDVNGDGFADIITGAPAVGHIKVFDGKTNAESLSFLDTRTTPTVAFVALAAVDADGDGLADIIAGESSIYGSYNGRTGVKLPISGSIDRLNTNFVSVG